jgi:uncharacterized protein
MYNRQILSNITKWLDNGKIAIIYGTRQVGKTTLTQEIVKHYTEKNYLESDIKIMNGDYTQTQMELAVQDLEPLKQIVSNKKILIIDEAQRIQNIGLTLKIIHDHFPELKIITTGSSSFELANKINEPLTGRNMKFMLLPLSFEELSQKSSIFELKYNIQNQLIYGSYPNVLALGSKEEKESYLAMLSGDYLYKDILSWENIRKPEILNKLLKYLALQVGSTITYTNIANNLDMNSRTVEKYIDLLEKCFVIFKLHAFSRNKNNELNRSFKIYFWDLGIRNSLINSYGLMDDRIDTGAIWENYCVLERIKFNQNNSKNRNYYFWRNYQQHEVDFIEEYDGKLSGYEFKYSKDQINKGSYNLIKDYPEATLELVNKNNIDTFLS